MAGSRGTGTERVFISLYIDEDASKKFATVPRELGYDAVTTAEAGQLEADDEEQLKFATEQGRAILTFNAKHFQALHTRYCQEGREHAGIIVLNRKVSFSENLRRLLRLLDSVTAEEMRGQIKFLSEYSEHE